MSLEERLRALATRGELNYLSLGVTGSTFEAVYVQASQAGGSFYGKDADPANAINKALDQFSATRRVNKYSNAAHLRALEMGVSLDDDDFG